MTIDPMLMRVGIGYDIHRFEVDRTLVLGGVEFPGEAGLAGHSDADVLVHAIIDAVLGAAGLGDIGQHFPPDDPRWAGASSLDLLARAMLAVREAGFEVESVDSTVIAEQPRLALHIAAMRERIAGAIAVDAALVNLKATTNERLGAIGREEGMAAMAVALLRERGERK